MKASIHFWMMLVKTEGYTSKLLAALTYMNEMLK